MGRAGNEANSYITGKYAFYIFCWRSEVYLWQRKSLRETRYSAIGYQQQIVGIAHRLGVLQGVVLRQVSQNEPESISERPGEGAGHAPQTPPPDTRASRALRTFSGISNYEFVFMLMVTSLVPIPSVQEVLLRVWQRDYI